MAVPLRVYTPAPAVNVLPLLVKFPPIVYVVATLFVNVPLLVRSPVMLTAAGVVALH